jgi:antitoxin MazE
MLSASVGLIGGAVQASYGTRTIITLLNLTEIAPILSALMEVPMRVPVRQLGNSAGLIIPKPILLELGLAAGDMVDLSLDEGHLVVAPVTSRRTGWAEAARSIAATDEDDQGWMEFGNTGDRDLQW